jgi:hypothetical protein
MIFDERTVWSDILQTYRQYHSRKPVRVNGVAGSHLKLRCFTDSLTVWIIDMTERGGPTTQSGILYQNSIAALHLGRLCDLRPRPARERIISVRIEAPHNVDDIVVTNADRTRDWIQAKENLRFSGPKWNKLWSDFESQRFGDNFLPDDRIRLLIGNNIGRMQALGNLSRRASGALDYREWYEALTKPNRELLKKVRAALSDVHRDDDSLFSLFSKIDIEIVTLEQIERDELVRWIPDSDTEIKTLFRLLRDRCGGHARKRKEFHTASLLEELKIEDGVSIHEPATSGSPAYRKATSNVYDRIEVPGTNVCGKITDLFLWPTLRENTPEQLRSSDIEDEDPRYHTRKQRGTIDLRQFPGPTQRRAVIVAGSGYGKSALLTAVAHNLSFSTWLPVLISLPELINSEGTVVEFLGNAVNRRFNVSVSWDYYCEKGLLALLFDGLDELAPRDRRKALELIHDFTSRYHETPWLLAVRDAKALSAPVDAKLLTIDILDYEQIASFCEAYGKAGSLIDPDELFWQIQTYSDLRLLVRIPLFLALLLATTRSQDQLPRTRADLLERYLYVVLHPEEYKPCVSTSCNGTDLRNAAECLAFRTLETNRIGMSEREAEQILQVQETRLSAEQQIAEMCSLGLIKRASNWISFAYPVVQEYLAACHLVSRMPDRIVALFELSSKRPWAQTVQFALEKHPEADRVINEILRGPDDAFGTVLRLIGQCIVSGAHVSTAVKIRIGDKLAALWPKLSFDKRDNLGKMLADGFTSPLPEQVRLLLTQGSRWVLQSGGAEILVAYNDPEMTKLVLKAFLDQDLEYQSHLHDWQIAVDAIAPNALEYYIERVKEKRTTSVELESLASLIVNLSRTNLQDDSHQLIVNDESLPPIIRLAGWFLGPRPISDDAFPLVNKILRAPEVAVQNYMSVHGWYLAVRALWESANAIERWRTFVVDHSFPEKRRDDLIFELLHSPFSRAEQEKVLMDLCLDVSFPPNLRYTVLLLLCYFGDRGATDTLLDSMGRLCDEKLSLLSAIIGKDGSEDTVARFLTKLDNLGLTIKQRSQVAHGLSIGLTWSVTLEGKAGYSMQKRILHPARSHAAQLIGEWAQDCHGSTEDYLRLLEACLGLGDKGAAQFLADKIVEIVQQDDSLLFQNFSFDFTFSNALKVLYEMEGTADLLPLTILEKCVQLSKSNTALTAARMIASVANAEALNTLLRLHGSVTKNEKEIDFYVRKEIESNIEELASRLGVRIVWDDDHLAQAK